MEKIRAIYTGDVRFDKCPVFELDTNNKYFIMITDDEVKYSIDCIIEDSDWIIFKVTIDDTTNKEIDGHAEVINRVKLRKMLKNI